MTDAELYKERTYRYFRIIKEHWVEERRKHEAKTAKIPESETEAIENMKAKYKENWMEIVKEMMFQIRCWWIVDAYPVRLAVFNYEKKEEE